MRTAHSADLEQVRPAVPTWLIAVRAAESKKATDIKVLDLSGITSFVTGAPFTPGFSTVDGQDITGSTERLRRFLDVGVSGD